MPTDKERLDWLTRKKVRALWPTSTGWICYSTISTDEDRHKSKSPRAAIDRAMHAMKAERTRKKEVGR